LETHDGVTHAQQKLAAKGLDLVVLNHAGEPGAGFSVTTNRVTLIDDAGVHDLPLQSKDAVAEALLDHIAELRRGR
jgi:phosphopantothenoylcysteine decarboxylase/phosphopantothenate--cysteine ligase